MATSISACLGLLDPASSMSSRRIFAGGRWVDSNASGIASLYGDAAAAVQTSIEAGTVASSADVSDLVVSAAAANGVTLEQTVRLMCAGAGK